MPKKGYKQSEAHRQAIADAKQAWWDDMRKQWEQDCSMLMDLDMPRPTLREYIRGEQASPVTVKVRKPRSQEHREKLRKAAIEGNYVERLKPYQKRRGGMSDADRKLKRHQRDAARRAAIRLAKQCMVGACGPTIQEHIRAEIGSLNVHDKDTVQQVIDYLVRIGFAEPSSQVPISARKKMSESAKFRHRRERLRKAELAERVKQRIQSAINKK